MEIKPWLVTNHGRPGKHQTEETLNICVCVSYASDVTGSWGLVSLFHHYAVFGNLQTFSVLYLTWVYHYSIKHMFILYLIDEETGIWERLSGLPNPQS